MKLIPPLQKNWKPCNSKSVIFGGGHLLSFILICLMHFNRPEMMR